MQSDGNCIYSIIQANDSHLYIGTDHGLFWFNTMSYTFDNSPHPTDPIGAIRSLAVFNDNLWIGSRDNGLYRYDYTSRKLYHFNNDKSLIYALEPTDDKLFIGTYESLSYYDINSHTRTYIPFPDGQKRMVNSLLWDAESNCVWIGTEGLLYKYDLTDRKIQQQAFLNHVTFKSLAIDDYRRLLIGTDDGLYVYIPQRDELQLITHDSRNENSLCNNIIWDIKCDNRNNVWFGTDKGISIAQSSSYYRFLHLAELVQRGEGNTLTNMFQDSNGNYWLGGDNGLIHVQIQDGDRSAVDWFNAKDSLFNLRHNRIRRIYEDTEGLIWIASDGGIAVYEANANRFKYFDIQDSADNVNTNWAYDIFEDTQGRLWIATYMGGLFVVDKHQLLQSTTQPFRHIIQHFSQEEGLDRAVYQIVNDDNGTLWLNTQKGLVSMNPKTFAMSCKHIYMDNMIYCNGSVWYSSLGNLFRYDVNKLTNVQVPYSQNSKHIYSFVAKDDKLWFSTTEGVTCLSTKDKKVMHIYRSGRSYLAGLYDNITHRIWWGEKDGLVSFSTSFDETDATPRPVYITAILSDGVLMHASEDFKIDNSHARNTIRLNRQEDITLELSNFSYDQQELNGYFYRINKDTEWHQLQQSQLSFTKLAGGNYTIRLCDTDPTLNPQATITTYSLIVPYPWYLCRVAIAIYIILIGLFIYFVTKGVLRRNKRRFEERERQQTLELSKLKMDFFVDMSHELKTPLSLIIAPLSKMISDTSNSKRRDTLVAIHQNALKLNSIIHKILNFRQLEYESENTLLCSHVDLCALIKECIQSFNSPLTERGISVNFSSDDHEIWLNVDKLKIESVFINLLSNAIKYCPDNSGIITITAHRSDHQVHIAVSDNGPGIQENELPLVFVRFFQGKNKSKHAEGTGIGLYLVKRNIELHNGHVEIANQDGLTVSITIPIEAEQVSSTAGTDTTATNDDIADNAHKKRILIIDDNKEIVSFLANALGEQYSCSTAFDGKDGVKKVQQLHVRLYLYQVTYRFTPWLQRNN